MSTTQLSMRSARTNRSLSETKPPLRVAALRLCALGLVSGYVDALGYLELKGVYTGAMTGNSTQFGTSLVMGAGHRTGLLALVLAIFFAGGISASLMKRRLRSLGDGWLIMGAILAIVQALSLGLDAPHRVPYEVGLLAVAMAIQGETLSRFDGISIQTVVMTNNMLKCASGIADWLAYAVGRLARRVASDRPEVAATVLPGMAWLTYVAGAAGAVVGAESARLPFLWPVPLLVALAWHLRRNPAT